MESVINDTDTLQKQSYNCVIKKYGNNTTQVKLFDIPYNKQSQLLKDVKKFIKNLGLIDNPADFENAKLQLLNELEDVKNDDYYINQVKNIEFDYDLFDSSQTDLINNKKQKENECLRISQLHTIQNIYNLGRSNNWEWFGTFTFNPKKLDSTDYKKVTQSMHDWLKYIKKNYAPDLKYILVPELHKDGKKYHFHGLFSNMGNLHFEEWKIKDNEQIYILKEYSKGFNTFSKIKDTSAVVGYIAKYITKDLIVTTKYKKRYWCSKNLQRPEEIYLQIQPEEMEMLFNSIGDVTFIKSYKAYNTHLDIFELKDF